MSLIWCQQKASVSLSMRERERERETETETETEREKPGSVFFSFCFSGPPIWHNWLILAGKVAEEGHSEVTSGRVAVELFGTGFNRVDLDDLIRLHSTSVVYRICCRARWPSICFALMCLDSHFLHDHSPLTETIYPGLLLPSAVSMTSDAEGGRTVAI